MDAEKRDRMVARVKAVFDKYPTFASLPAAKDGGDIQCLVESDNESEYIRALYEVCAKGEVVGRGVDTIFGVADKEDGD